ncbi:MAG: DNA internalization-related competence protein ComEC/Rec2 [Myxococcota bacterium]
MNHAPAVILFVAGFLGAYGGLFASVQVGFPSLVAVICAGLALGSPKPLTRTVLAAVAAAMLTWTVAAHTRRQYDACLRTIPREAVVYAGTVLDLVPSLDRGKRAHVRVTGWLRGEEHGAVAFDMLLRLHGAASALKIQAGDRIRVYTKARPLRPALAPGQFDPYLFGLARGIHAKGRVSKPARIGVLKSAGGLRPLLLSPHKASSLRSGTLRGTSLATPRDLSKRFEPSEAFGGKGAPRKVERSPPTRGQAFWGKSKATQWPFARARSFLRQRFTQLLTPREAGVLLALLIGDTQLFDQEQHVLYRRVGAGHLLAVSGLQVSLLALALFKALHVLLALIPFVGRLSYARTAAAVLATLAVWAFVALCGAPPSCVRAAAMATALLLGSLLGRSASGLDALGVAGFCTVLLSPTSAIDPSFLLSYAAIIGLLLCVGPDFFAGDDQEKAAPSVRRMRALAVVALASLASGLMTLPLGAHLFGEVVPAGILTNIILVPVASLLQVPALALGLIGALTARFHVAAGAAIAHAGAWFAVVLEALCDLLGDLVGGIIPVEAPSRLLTLGYSLAAMLVLSSLLLRRWWVLAVGATLAAICLWGPAWLEPRGVRVTVLAVGQGDSTVFELPSGQVMLVDGGGSPYAAYDPGERMVVPFLARRGIKHIDVMVVTHPDGDHILGLMAVLQQVSVGEIWHSGFPEDQPLMAQLLRLARERGVPVRVAKELLGSHCFGATRVDVLAPHPQGQGELLYDELSKNENSLVLRVSHGPDSALWPGDVEAWGEHLLLRDGCDLRSTLLKAGHHGSRTSSTPEFIRAVRARHVIFCTGQDNRFGFPHAETVQRFRQTGAQLWDSGVHGQTTFWLTGKGVVAKPFRTVPLQASR